tara:strand:+ start:447 stop:1427 length:981 start_codon:yes stop_codon:yes gene_type:complete
LFKHKKISIIISTFNRPHNIIEIIKLINKQLKIPLDIEVLICDSNSKENLRILNFIKIFNSFDIKYLNLKKNHQAFKRNQGAKHAKGNYLIFLDDDCFPDKNFLFDFYKKLKLQKKRFIYCGEVEYIENYRIKNLIKFRNSRSKKFKKPYELISAKNFVTMNMGFNKKLIKNYENFFDNRFSYYGFEDFELAYRLKQKGILIELINAKILHRDFRNFKIWLLKFYFLGKFGISDIRKININAAKKSVFNKIYENKILKIFLILPFIVSILLFIEKLIVFMEKNLNIYIPIFYKIGMLLSFVRGMHNKNNIKKDFNSYNNSLKNWYE